MSDRNSTSDGCTRKSLTLAVLGCGKLSIAVLYGLLSNPDHNSDSTLPPITRVIATVRTAASAQRIQQQLESVSASSSSPVSHNQAELVVVLQEGNALAAREADVIILGCKPYSFQDVLCQPDVRSALLEGPSRKILVSIMGGVTTAQLNQCLYNSSDTVQSLAGGEGQQCLVIRAIPNVAARVRQSMTVLALPKPTGSLVTNSAVERSEGQDSGNSRLLLADHTLIGKIFECVGDTQWLPEELMNLGASLCASSPAIFATLIESVAASAGTIPLEGHGGISKDTALRMVTQAARGTVDLILGGQQPEAIRKEVATEGGSTMRGLNTMSKLKVADSMNEVMTDVITATGGLGAKK